MSIPHLPKPPYYIVAFASQRRDGDHGYGAMADQIGDLAVRQPGYLGIESARDADGFGITNSYWTDEASIRAWKAEVDHLSAQTMGRRDWYQTYAVRVGRIERAYGFEA
jgi:heme-degrading monooxygenase HmoA